MKNLKKITAIILSASMILSLAACASSEPAGTKTEEATTAATATTAAVTETTEAAETAAEPEERLPLVKDGEKKKLVIGINSRVTTDDYETNEYTLWLEEQTGVDLEFVLFSSDATEAAQQLAMMVSAGEKLPDILLGMEGIDGNEYGEDGYFLNLKPYFDNDTYFLNDCFDLMDENEKTAYFTAITDPNNGEIYSIPGWSLTTGMDGVACGAAINKTWLDKLGLEMPTTIDELHDVLVAFRDNDPNGNGKKDEIPLVSADEIWRCIGMPWLLNAYIYLFDEYPWNVDNGTVYMAYNQDEYREGLKTLNAWYKEGLISPLSFSMTTKEEYKALNHQTEDGDTIIGVLLGHPTLNEDPDLSPVYEYVSLAPLKDATGKGGKSPRAMYNANKVSYISADTEDPELAWRFFEFLSSKENFMWQRYGLEGRDWEYIDESEGLTNILGNKTANFRTIDKNVYTNQNNTCWHYVYGFQWGRTNVSAGENDGSWTSTRSVLSNQMIADADAAGEATETIRVQSFTAEEAEINSEIKTPLIDYAKQSRAQFITGVMDPSSDADWNAYLSNLENLGIKELTEIGQSEYNRH